MNTEQVKDEIQRLILEITEQLPDASVQVLCSWPNCGNTASVQTGVGNWYARQGMAHEFINVDIAQENANQIANAIKPSSDNGEEWKQ